MILLRCLVLGMFIPFVIAKLSEGGNVFGSHAELDFSEIAAIHYKYEDDSASPSTCGDQIRQSLQENSTNATLQSTFAPTNRLNRFL